jgi:hypothetical protein
MVPINPLNGPVATDLVPGNDFRVARHYLRYYQRGGFVFAAGTLVCAAAQLHPVTTTMSSGWPAAGQLALAVGALIYMAAPYRRKVTAFFRRRIAPLFDLLSDRR